MEEKIPEQQIEATEEFAEEDNLETVTEEINLFHQFSKPGIVIIIIYIVLLIVGIAVRLPFSKVIHDAKEAGNNSSTIGEDSSSSIEATIGNEVKISGTSDENKGNVIVALNPEETFLAVLENESRKIHITMSTYGTADNNDLQWESSDTSIATVSETGEITGVSAGKCTIKVSVKTDSTISTEVPVVVRHLEEIDGCTYIDGILVANKVYSLSESYDPGGLTDETAEAFYQMTVDASNEGLNLYVGSDYRSYSEQVEIYNDYCTSYGWELADTFSARPGFSEHQTGMVIDCNTIDDAFGETAEAEWIALHCAEYGFIISYPADKVDITGYQYEPWHIRYVGVDIAKEINELGLCLEEYLGIDLKYKKYEKPWEEDSELSTTQSTDEYTEY